MAAACGLVVSGIASYAAWQTVQDGRDDELREQASSVNTWNEVQQDQSVFVHVVNRSFDAVSLWALPFRTPEGKVKIISSTLPPCTELVFDPNKVPNVSATTTRSAGFLFYDRSGRPWQRLPYGLFEAEADTVNEIQSAPGTRVTLDAIRNAGGIIKAAQGCKEG
ncbi:hypothetical protein [Streptomyces dubilierae]|uniref:Secreted protein n=1 Tax=Streptomyces dubilierae TaxID=3075533 RepID=A0ABU2P1H4_9ACTN|nr:hypothetical protein [Streptomyces sp. DSM 41921]MDT0385991.1 hypothetical protein [Streptomyces sp. DSM 41921]